MIYLDRLFGGLGIASLHDDNLRPTKLAMTVDAQGARLRSWSLIPGWANEPKLKFSTFNARAETVHEKPAFRTAWKRSQRCAVPASAYSEWPVIDGEKLRHRVQLVSGMPLLLGGLWDTWQQGSEVRHSFTIITVPPLPGIAWLHHRMPLFLPEQVLDDWLHSSPEEAFEFLRPMESGELVVAPA